MVIALPSRQGVHSKSDGIPKCCVCHVQMSCDAFNLDSFIIYLRFSSRTASEARCSLNESASTVVLSYQQLLLTWVTLHPAQRTFPYNILGSTYVATTT